MNNNNNDTIAFNQMRSEEWITELNKRDSRIFIIMGRNRSGSIQIFCDDSMSPHQVAKVLRDYANQLDKGNYTHKHQRN